MDDDDIARQFCPMLEVDVDVFWRWESFLVSYFLRKLEHTAGVIDFVMIDLIVILQNMIKSMSHLFLNHCVLC